MDGQAVHQRAVRGGRGRGGGHPGSRPPARCSPRSRRPRSRRSRRRWRRREGVPGWARTTPKDRATALLKLADRHRGEGRGASPRLESRNCGKPLRRGPRRRDPGHRRRVPLLRGRRALHARALAAGEYLPGYTSMIRRDPRRRRGLDRAVELSADDGGVEAGAGAGRAATRWCSSRRSRRRSPR